MAPALVMRAGAIFNFHRLANLAASSAPVDPMADSNRVCVARQRQFQAGDCSEHWTWRSAGSWPKQVLEICKRLTPKGYSAL